MQVFETGDTVTKINGSPVAMRVTCVEKDRITCSWLDDEGTEEAVFNPWELKLLKMHDGEENFSQNRTVQL